MPKVIGDKLDNAKKKLDESHLLYTVTSKIDPGAVQEQITDQVPKEGKVMPGDTIALTIAVPPEPITLKNYIGKQIGIAQGELESMGLKVSLAERIDPQIQQGQVVDRAPKEGTKVKPGDTITLIGSVTLVPVPVLNGANWRLLVKDFNARFGLNIDLVQGSNCNAPVGDQSLKPPLFVPKETSMTLTLQGGGTAGCYRRPGRSIFLRDFLNSPAAEIQKIPRIPRTVLITAQIVRKRCLEKFVNSDLVHGYKIINLCDLEQEHTYLTGGEICREQQSLERRIFERMAK